jgi:Fe-S oxidoreductase
MSVDALAIVLWALCVAVTVAAVVLVVRTITRMVRIVHLGQPDNTRSASTGRRLLTMVRETVGHTRMFQWSAVAAAHWFVFAGFIVLSLLVLEAYGEVISPRFELPLLGGWGVWNIVVEILGVTTVLGGVTLIVFRQLAHPRRAGRRSRFTGSSFWQAYFVEIVVVIEGLGVLLVRGFKSAAGYLDAPSWSDSVARGLGAALGGGDAAIRVMASVKVFSAMVWIIVIALNITMGVAWHRFTVWPNVFFKREASGAPALGALKPMMSNGAPIDFEKADPEVDVFGAGKIEDFSWKGFLDFTTCTECGRCQSQCPAWNTGKPLSPKLLVMSLRDHAYAKAPYLLAGGGTDSGGNEKLSEAELAELRHRDPLAALEAGRPLVGGPDVNGIIDPDALWACTNCGACVEQCPVDIEHVDHIVDMRRYQVMIESEFPTELGTLFKNLENKGNPWGQNQSGRLDWAKDLPFEIPVVDGPIGDDVEYLFWIGCAGAYDDRARRTTRATAELLHIAGVGFAVLGEGETCTGDPARRAGNEFLFQMLAQQNVETLGEAFGERERKKIIATCPHCFNTLLNEYPLLGGYYEVLHHTQVLNRLVREKKLVPVADPGRDAKVPVTYHDPCFLGRHNRVYEPPREVLAAAGLAQSEMPRHHERALCCGAGGARMWMEEKIGKRINLERTDEALATSAKKIVTACPYCNIMIGDGLTARQAEGLGEGVEVLDVAQMLLTSVKG